MADSLPRRKTEDDVPAPIGDGKDERPSAVVTNLADVVEEPISWLWPGRLAFGKFNLLDGDPGDGKSLFTIDLAARVTTGRPLPGFYSGSEAASVVILAAEDGVADTIKPRFTAAGGDPALVHVMTGTRRGKKDGFPSLTKDSAALADLGHGVTLSRPGACAATARSPSAQPGQRTRTSQRRASSAVGSAVAPP